MAEKVNTESVFTGKTFITLDTLSYFWTKTKAHVEGLVNPISADVTALKGTVGDATKGLVMEVASLRTEVNALGGGEGGIQGMIDNSIVALNLPNTYDAKGAAATALTEAKSYVDSKVDGKFDAAGAAAEVDGKLTTHAADTVAHVTADERTAWNSAKTAIDAFLKDADMTEKAVDTLKELQTYMTTDGAAAAELVGRVKTLEDGKDAYVGADETVLQNANAYADSLVLADGVAKFDAAGAAATAKTEAIADAKTYIDGKVDGKFDAAGAAAQALTDAKTYVDGKVDGKFDAAGSADAAQTAAIAQAKLDAAEALKLYYTRIEVDNLLSTNSTGDRAYAKQYTDELYKSFVFAQSSDIDAIFATTNA